MSSAGMALLITERKKRDLDLNDQASLALLAELKSGLELNVLLLVSHSSNFPSGWQLVAASPCAVLLSGLQSSAVFNGLSQKLGLVCLFLSFIEIQVLILAFTERAKTKQMNSSYL